MLAVGILGIAVSLLALQFKTIKPEYGIMLSVAGCLFIFLYSLSRIEDITALIDRISELTSISRDYIKILLKITGITFVAEIASDIAKDCGFGAISNQIQIFGKLSVLAISMPVFVELISSVGKLLS